MKKFKDFLFKACYRSDAISCGISRCKTCDFSYRRINGEYICKIALNMRHILFDLSLFYPREK